jgi:uncharacterized membrane protein
MSANLGESYIASALWQQETSEHQMTCAMTWRTQLAAVLLICLALAILATPAGGQSESQEDGQSLILNVYLDITGKALVTGYVESPEGLPFLNISQYSYENDTNQLYVLTNALTIKEGDIWTLIFETIGYYEDFRLAVYLPGDFKVKNITSSADLEHFLTASNDSIAVEFQGYDATDPFASIEYQQPLQTNGPPLPPISSTYLIPAMGALILLTAAAVWWLSGRKRPKGPRESEKVFREAKHEHEALPQQDASDEEVSPRSDELHEEVSLDNSHEGGTPGAETESQPVVVPTEDNGVFAEMAHEDHGPEEQDLTGEEEASIEHPEPEEEITETDETPAPPAQSKIEVSSEMAAVMETLTPRERAVLQALIDRGGRSTQADLRYETRTPKSSLTGIIYSLERRKLITKKEWGRTNVIELSDWFLSKKE